MLEESQSSGIRIRDYAIIDALLTQLLS
jgi:hypothetical protein